MPSPDEPSTVIIGAGIIGCATAYYLSDSSTTSGSIHLVESSPELFASASGKAGGFLAADWFSPTSAALGELSFRLHEELACEQDGHKRWGYSRSTGSSLVDGGGDGEDWLQNGGSRADMAGMHEYANDGEQDLLPKWLKRQRGDTVTELSDEGGVAQVDPLRLSEFLLEESRKRSVQLHQPARALNVVKDGEGRMCGLRLQKDGTDYQIPCTRLLVTAGAWTPQVFKTLFPSSKLRIPISPYAGHSIVVKSPKWTAEHEAKGCHAIFTSMRSGFSPEIFSRIGEEIYIAGLNSSDIPLPSVASDAKIDKDAIDELMTVARRLLGNEPSDLELLREGLCFRPVTSRGAPILARITDDDLRDGITRPDSGGVFVAAGHGPWGISLSLGSGKVMAEMLEGKKTSADIRRLGMP